MPNANLNAVRSVVFRYTEHRVIFPRRVAGSGLANPPAEPGVNLHREGRERRRPILVRGVGVVGHGRMPRTPVGRRVGV